MDVKVLCFLQIGQTNGGLCESRFNQVPLIPYLQVCGSQSNDSFLHKA